VLGGMDSTMLEHDTVTVTSAFLSFLSSQGMREEGVSVLQQFALQMEGEERVEGEQEEKLDQ